MNISPAANSNPLEDTSYLLSVIQVIADSLHEQSFTSAHDLLDAYTTFSNRIRSQSQMLQDCTKSLPALDSLTAHKNNLVGALQRDVGLAHVDPFSTLSRLPLSSARTMSGSNIQSDTTVDTKQYARDLSSLCQHALSALTTIFRFPAFHSIFTEHDLSSLFGNVLAISLADQLPVLNEAKIYSLSLWTLACHRLPVSVLRSRQYELLSALRRCLDAMRQPGNITLDGLKAIMHVLEYYPTDLPLVLSPLLPPITMLLFQESVELRLNASIVLGKLANVLIHRRNHSLTEWKTFSDNILAYLESPPDNARLGPGEASLSQIVRAAISMKSQARRGDGPTLMLVVLASLIIICGPSLFSKPAALHFILQSLALALKHERSIVRALYAHVWKCLVWTFSHMLSSDENIEPASIHSALYVIKQELGGGIGIAVAAVLLAPNQVSATQSHELTDRISQALSVIEAMVRMDCKHTRREGFMLLLALTSGATVEQSSLRMYEVPALALFDGTVIGAEWNELPTAIDSIPMIQPSVRQLEEAEIAKHYKALLQIWKYVASRRAGEEDSDLVATWQSILVAQVHQLQNERHATAAEILKYASAIMVECLPSLPSADYQPDWGSWNVQGQLRILSFIDRLWSVMRDAFSAFSLWESASRILASILKYAFHVLDPGVQTSWGALCANLMITASPSFLRDLRDLTESQMVVSTQRELWGVVAKSLSSSDPKLEWKELVKFLAIPICGWVLTENELQAWEGILCNAAIFLEDAVLLVQHFIAQYFQGTEVENWESTVPLLRLLLSYLNEQGHSPTAELLYTVDVSLTASYSRASHSSEILRNSLQLLVVIRNIITSSSPATVIHIVQTLQGCLCVWIEDRAEVMSIDDFNSVAVSLYCDTIKVLEALPLSIRSLQDLASFLASAFSRIPTPAIAPFAFEKFWRATYHGHTEFYGSLPPKILSCLACFVDAFGGDLTEGLPLSTESQQSISDGFRSQSYQDLGEFSFRESLWSSSIGNEGLSEALGAEVTPQARQRSLVGPEDTTFVLASSDDEVSRPTVLRQLDEYRSEMDISLPDGLEESMSNHGQESRSSIPLPLRPSPGSRSLEISSKALNKTNAKRKHADQDDVPRKRSRTSRTTLRSVCKLESEPATRDVTPVNANITRTSSVPLKRKSVFDGVQVPTFREVLRREKARKADVREHAPSLLAGLTSIPRTPSSRSEYRTRPPPAALPSSVGSDEDLNWENFHIDTTSSELDIERSLVGVYHSSPLHSPTSVPQETEDEPQFPSRSQPRSYSEGSPSVPTRQTLRRANTGSERLDALLDVYTSVAQGASQIPMSELLQATRLVHQIGAVLTEQMGKKMGDP